MAALAAGSTIAGNFFILGAASNVIIIQNAEKKAGKTLTSLEFARIGIPPNDHQRRSLLAVSGDRLGVRGYMPDEFERLNHT